MPLNTVEELVADIRAGKMVILMDDEDRENEGDLVIAATHVRAEDINFMITHARGLVCLTLSRDRCKQLNLPLMVDANGAQHGTNFTLSIEAAEGISTGISPAERAHTIQTAVAAHAKPSDIVQPGHIFPLMAQPGGVLHRAGHTEAGCDLSRLAGLEPASVICEIINEDGTMARRADLEIFAEKHGLKIGTIADLIHYRMTNEQTVERIDQQSIDTEYGTFDLYRYRELGNPDIHLALVKGEPKEGVTTVRVHGFNPVRDLLKLNKKRRRVRMESRQSAARNRKQRSGCFGLDWPASFTRLRPSLRQPYSTKTNQIQCCFISAVPNHWGGRTNFT